MNKNYVIGAIIVGVSVQVLTLSTYLAFKAGEWKTSMSQRR